MTRPPLSHFVEPSPLNVWRNLWMVPNEKMLSNKIDLLGSHFSPHWKTEVSKDLPSFFRFKRGQWWKPRNPYHEIKPFVLKRINLIYWIRIYENLKIFQKSIWPHWFLGESYKFIYTYIYIKLIESLDFIFLLFNKYFICFFSW